MINLENITFAYSKTTKLFSQLNLNLQAGNIYGLLGKNGAGKTTLLKIICGLLFPQDGICEVLGSTPKERSAKFLANIYFVPEEFFLPALTLDKYVELYAPFYPKFDHQLFVEHLKEFELHNDKNLDALSYGQRKKVLLAFALASNCDLIILDEPTNGLDIPSKGQFRKLLTAAISDDRMIIISTHQVREVEHLINSIVVLDEGNIIFQQSIDEIMQGLTFTFETESSADALYAEKSFNGYKVVIPKQEEFESEVDIEMLFNTVLANREKIAKLFSRR
jgi:ABC-2 type transport system ATP-binding protein